MRMDTLTDSNVINHRFSMKTLTVDMIVWFRKRTIFHPGGEAEYKELIQDDVNSLYEILYYVGTESGEWKGRRSVIHRLMEKLRSVEFDFDDVGDDREVVGSVEFDKDEMELVLKLIESPPEKVQYKGDKIVTIQKFDDLFNQFKKDNPEEWAKDAKVGDKEGANDDKPKPSQ